MNIAAIQMLSTDKVDANLAAATKLLYQAHEQQAQLVVLPENFAFIGAKEHDKLAVAEELGKGPIQDFLAQQAKDLGLWIVAGTIPMRSPDSSKALASCLVYDDSGQCVARYNKIHMFDVTVADHDEPLSESACTYAGDELKVIDTPCGRLGLSVCYDLRFPELYRALQQQGAELLAVPAAFLASTGAAHWEVLLRARAIENLCYVIAPNQFGEPPSGPPRFGHSMIINPWGKIITELPEGNGVIIAAIEQTKQQALRASFPALEHRRVNDS